MDNYSATYILESDIFKVNAVVENLNTAVGLLNDAIYEITPLGFNVWLTHQNHPDGWDDVPMKADKFSRPCILLAKVVWIKEKGNVIGVHIETDAIELKNHLGQLDHSHDFKRLNRLEDIHWAIEKTLWLFAQAGVQTPSIFFDS